MPDGTVRAHSLHAIETAGGFTDYWYLDESLMRKCLSSCIGACAHLGHCDQGANAIGASRAHAKIGLIFYAIEMDCLNCSGASPTLDMGLDQSLQKQLDATRKVNHLSRVHGTLPSWTGAGWLSLMR
eukprot:3856737-Amphidinium_carterae.1